MFDYPKTKADVALESAGPSKFLLRITPKTTLPEGDFRFVIQLRPVLTSQKLLPAISLWVSGTVQGDIQANPRQVNLGPSPVGKMGKETLVVQSSTGKDFEVIGVEGESESLKLLEKRGSVSPGLHFLKKTHSSPEG